MPSFRILPFADAALAEALAVLRSGGTVAHATETCYGFACDLSHPAAVERLFLVKQRPFDQPVSALFFSLEQAKQYVVWNARAQELAAKHLPGPLTLILPLRTDAPLNISSTPPARTESVRSGGLPPSSDGGGGTEERGGTLGIRISSHPHACALAAAFGSPLSTTSANLHGEPNPYSATDIAAQFEGAEHRPDLILDAGALPLTPPSTVMDLTGEGSAIVRRQGSLRQWKRRTGDVPALRRGSG